MAEKYIIELDRYQIEFMAAMTHLWLAVDEDDTVAKGLLDELMMQSNFVFSDPHKHGIGINSFVIVNKTPATKWGTKISQHLGDGAGLRDIMIKYTGD